MKKTLGFLILNKEIIVQGKQSFKRYSFGSIIFFDEILSMTCWVCSAISSSSLVGTTSNFTLLSAVEKSVTGSSLWLLALFVNTRNCKATYFLVL